MTLDLATVDTLNRCNVSEMEKVGHALNPQVPGSCEEFGRHVKKVEAALIHTYSIVAYVSLHQKNPAEAAALWKHMGNFCDVAINALRTLKERFPFCGAPELYDMALDYKIAAEDRYQQNIRDSECLTLKIPADLFPKKNS
ncbi:MAG TPA: hypothetical protein VK633_00385 [Verrucomicrobiae bacterium]|nr:hypothetical protein [Verrucomicrobiae bacterium]